MPLGINKNSLTTFANFLAHPVDSTPKGESKTLRVIGAILCAVFTLTASY